MASLAAAAVAAGKTEAAVAVAAAAAAAARSYHDMLICSNKQRVAAEWDMQLSR